MFSSLYFQVLRNVAVVVYNALDYNLHEDEQCQMSQELEELITHMTEDGKQFVKNPI